MNIYKQIYKTIKKYNNIVIARHIGADPDAIGSSLALRDSIKNTFPHKQVFTVGSYSSRFKFMGIIDKLDEIPSNCLLIVLDTPDIKRIDSIELEDFEYIIKIDHHPKIDDYGNIELIDDEASSTCQILTELILSTKLKLTKEIAEKLYLGIIADTDRFLHDYTSSKTFALTTKLIEKTNLDFTSLYEPLYAHPLVEVRFQGYIYQNLKITDNGLAYIKITDDCLKKFEVDAASTGNMINDLKFINEIQVWIFCTEDVKSNIIRVNIRSNGPYINEIAMKYGGGGHKYASGVRLPSWEIVGELIDDYDNLVKKYNEKN
ncbi:MAG: bifunctional oligoribonuclease/PAP phosphatase NrnA [bacterium]|nr:bifunctional oligoribonuclease/PAP phosphatase NrnA [bacterium]